MAMNSKEPAQKWLVDICFPVNRHKLAWLDVDPILINPSLLRGGVPLQMWFDSPLNPGTPPWKCTGVDEYGVNMKPDPREQALDWMCFTAKFPSSWPATQCSILVTT